LFHLLNLVAFGQFRLPGQHLWRCRPTRWCRIFCSLPRLFHHDRNSQPLPGLGTVTQLHRDPWLCTHLPGLAKNAAPRRRRHYDKEIYIKLHDLPIDIIDPKIEALWVKSFDGYRFINSNYQHQFSAIVDTIRHLAEFTESSD
jgi:hypothetical protein